MTQTDSLSRKRVCVYCGMVGSRTQVAGGFAHKRCIPVYRKVRRPKSKAARAALSGLGVK